LATSPAPLPPEVQQFYLPVRRTDTVASRDVESREGGAIEVKGRHLLYVPGLLGLGRVHFVEQRRNVSGREDFALLGQAPEGAGVRAWEQAQPLDLTARDLSGQPEPEAYFDELPKSVTQAQQFTALQKDLVDHLYRTCRLTLLYSPTLKMYSQPGEDERGFMMRVQQAAREQRDTEVDKTSERYEKRLVQLKERLRRAEATLDRQQAEVEARKRETVVAVGESVVGLFLGRRSTRIASSALSKQRQASLAKMKVTEAGDTVEALQQEIKQLEEELQAEASVVRDHWEEALQKAEQVPIAPRRTDIEVDLFGLAWAPHWQVTYQDRGGTTRTTLVPAY
jgi:hypothetical protein